MFRRCQLERSLVQYAALSATAGKLNSLLDIRSNGEPVSRDTLKKFIQSDVMPILRGSSLDRRHDSSEMRRFMAQLYRDAAFAAVILRANPNGVYVNCLADCARHDHERLQFIQKMTSSQVSRAIEHLCRAGVRDSSVYGALIARLDITVLKEVARVMFAFTEANLHQQVVFFLVPLYCGETWELTYEPSADYSNTQNKGCSVFDAVRVLRALSKAVRGVIEEQRLAERASRNDALTAFPTESFQRLRTAITAFILKHEHLLRGGHWINFSRAMVHFPAELQTMQYVDEHETIVRVVEALPRTSRQREDSQDAEQRRGRALLTSDLAALGLDRLFAPVERPGGRFDVASLELTKVLPVIDQVSAPASTQKRRRALVVDAVRKDMNRLNFAALVRFIAALRQIEGSAPFEPALRAAVAAVSARLESNPAEAARLSRDRLVQLASLLAAFRVRSCRGFSRHVAAQAQAQRQEQRQRQGQEQGQRQRQGQGQAFRGLRAEGAAALINALASTAEADGAAAAAAAAECLLDAATEGPAAEGAALVLESPLQCARLLRAMVLVGAAPSLQALERLFGNAAPLRVSPALRAAGASVLFDLARSLYHFARLEEEPPARGDGSGGASASREDVLWSHGIIGALLPLLAEMTVALRDELGSSSDCLARGVTYVPLAWRAAMEAVFPYVDVNLDAVTISTMQRRLAEAYTLLRKLASAALEVAALQRNIYTDAQPPSFAANGQVHVVSLLLMLEHMVYHAAWQSEVRTGQESKDASESLHALRADYDKLVTTQMHNIGGTAMTLVEDMLTPATGKGGLDREAVLEITTNLPFAVSLVVSPGPVNTLFCERAVTAMIKGVSDETA